MEALSNNLDIFKNRLPSGTKVMVMVKASAYGSGAEEIAQMLVQKKVDYLGVAYVDEGVMLRNAGINIPIMVMNTAFHELDLLYSHQLEPVLYSIQSFETFSKFLKNKIDPKPYSVHIELDTGMHRLGFMTTDIDQLNILIQENESQLRIASIFSHLAMADDATKHDYTDAAKMGNLAASLVVSKLGTASLSAGELLATAAPAYSAPAPEALEMQIADWRKQGLKIGFTNGCFDLLHPGHLQLLSEAAKSCDRLVVGLNSDASVKQLKGEHRPVQPQSVRQANLASLRAVDAVIIFDEDTPINLITQLKPDVLVKGGDYRAEDVVGFNELTASGGHVKIIPLLDRYSTTSFLESHQLG